MENFIFCAVDYPTLKKAILKVISLPTFLITVFTKLILEGGVDITLPSAKQGTVRGWLK